MQGPMCRRSEIEFPPKPWPEEELKACGRLVLDKLQKAYNLASASSFSHHQGAETNLNSKSCSEQMGRRPACTTPRSQESDISDHLTSACNLRLLVDQRWLVDR
ncbi:hypothetical protein PoB_002679700 [Plakobranchus ocellatus]|uniref:Uncharacterized protein n=1 Tax=Plakobranchus ocellatus TaxID=259542 RepID=A0AAV3ZZ26_9GAST|nr:hypothetical protein PoB_002679700 [Plakobranchus ocellatus]